MIPSNFISGAAITTGASSQIYGSVLELGNVNNCALSSIIHNADQAQPSPTPTPPPPIENLQIPLVSEIFPADNSCVHIVLHNLIPGQSVTITMLSVNL